MFHNVFLKNKALGSDKKKNVNVTAKTVVYGNIERAHVTLSQAYDFWWQFIQKSV